MLYFTTEHVNKWVAWTLLLGLVGCVEPYVPAVVDAPTSALVVDGFINGNGRTRIKLSRTASLASTTTPPVEKGAKLFVIDDTGLRYALTEQVSGSYQSDSLLLNPSRKYQLRITTAANITYESDRVPLKITPPIDKLNWKLDDSQLDVQLSTHDASQQSRYYRWSCVETWEFNAAFHSDLEYDAKKAIIVGRTTPIYTCWRTERPSVIKQGSTAQLSQDELTDVNLLSISTRAERLKIRYSVLVNQWAETPEEFAYYELLRKNTEAVGTVNDPLPTQLTGNVHRVDNSSEPVLGFVGAHTIQQQRLFIDRQELPPHSDYDYDTPYLDCLPSRELFKDSLNKLKVLSYPNTNIFKNPDNVPIMLLVWPDTPGGDPIPQGYVGSSRNCVDCRVRGTNMKPGFW
jgi:hypothetical protein